MKLRRTRYHWKHNRSLSDLINRILSLPAFTKLGAKISTPSWMSSDSNELMFPRLFHNDAYRASLASLPASSYSVLYSSDHASGVGSIGRVDFDDIEGTWTDFGSAIHTGANQRETPHPVYDPINNRVNVYVHDGVGSGTANNDQHTRLLTTTNLQTLSSVGAAISYGQHSGYAQVEYRNNQFEAWHLLGGGEGFFNAHSVSADGVTFTYDKTIITGQQHIAGEGKLLNGVPYYFEYGGLWYGLGVLTTRPRSGNLAGNEALVAWRVETDTWKPIGGYFTLVTPGSISDPDYRLTNYYDIAVVDGVLYLLYIGVADDGEQSICLAKASETPATQTPPLWEVNPDGSLVRGTTVAVNNVYDATGVDDLPAWITKAVVSGSDNSNQVDGSYYELKTGSGSTQSIYLRSTATYIPANYETLEITLRGLSHSVSGVTEERIGMQIGFVDSLTNLDGTLVLWTPSNDRLGEYRRYANHVIGNQVATYSIPWLDTSGSVSEWARATEWDITFRIHNNATRISLLINDQVAFHRNISADSVGFGSGAFGYFRISNFTTFPQIWARFKSFEIKAWT